jgi:23S rRNA (cytidine1920-2'-O)/16S rRNA (cytidine1409-2'-O)-methyltransferase
MGRKKVRADQLLVLQGLAESRERARRLIMAGHVVVGKEASSGERVAKPGSLLLEDTPLSLIRQERFVSRGGAKLLTALEAFSLDVQGWVALDVGASTGGFTDCLLQSGALRVYALDVGYGQLHWKLRQDSRVVVLERVNIRHAREDLLPEPVDLTVVDCSFISLRKVLHVCAGFTRPGGLVIALIKPQFELDRGSTDKGVVRSARMQETAVERVLEWTREAGGFVELGVVPSQITGPKGNQEYLALWRIKAQPQAEL